MREALAWQPILGGGFGIRWTETLAMDLREALDLCARAQELRASDMRLVQEIVRALAGRR